MELFAIPTGVNSFDKYQGVFCDLIEKNAKDWNIPAADVAKVMDFNKEWVPAFKLQNDKNTASKVNRINRDNIRKPYEAEIKYIIEQFLLNKPTVTDDKKAMLGIKKKQAPSSTASDSKGYPIIEIRSATPSAHGIVFHDSEATTSKAKPKGVAFCEVRFKVVDTGAAAPVGTDDYSGYEMISASGGEVKFKEEQRGKTAHYFSRWRRTDGSTGSWTPFSISRIIS